MTRALALLLTLLTACGRSDVVEEGVTPLPPAPPVTTREDPLAIFAGDTSRCPAPGGEADMVQQPYEYLDVVRMQVQQECSGAGGDWFVGLADNGYRDLFLGNHACWFASEQPGGVSRFPQDTQLWGVVRSNQTAGLFHGPEGWCITSIGGQEPVTSDCTTRAWAVFRTEAGARAAHARWARAD